MLDIQIHMLMTRTSWYIWLFFCCIQSFFKEV